MGISFAMSLLRLIARLDIKGHNLIKPVRMEGLRVVGDPNKYALKYHDADELLFIDVVASLYGRNNLAELIERATDRVFIPVTVGGGIRTLEDVRRVFNSGADKVAINTAAMRNPQLIYQISQRYGSQAVVVSIEAKRVPSGWEAYTDNGRERTHKDAVEWAFEAERLGAGELLVTSVDQEGTMRGFDLDLIGRIAPHVSVPVVACGGMGTLQHLFDALAVGADAVACASVLHYDKLTIGEIREYIEKQFSDQGRSQARGEEARPQC